MMGGMPRARFAGGGSVKKAIKALNAARAMLEDSDPDFDHIADLLSKEVPQASGIAAKIKKTANFDGDDLEVERKEWLDIQKQMKDLKLKLKNTKE